MVWDLFDSMWRDPWMSGREEPFWRRRSAGRLYPAVNIYGNEEKVVVTAEIPGLEAGQLDLKLEGRTLAISGKRTLAGQENDEVYSCRERSGGDFSRSILLPFEVEADKVEARYERGVLVITLPRVESDKPRRIEVKVG